MSQKYAEYVKSPEWKAFCKTYFQSNMPKNCITCDCQHVRLYHRCFERYTNEIPIDVLPICKDCWAIMRSNDINLVIPVKELKGKLIKCFGFQKKEIDRRLQAWYHADKKTKEHIKQHRDKQLKKVKQQMAANKRYHELKLDKPAFNYGEYLKSEEWRNLKERYFKSKMPKYCVICTSEDNINLHHINYEQIGKEYLKDLVPLCSTCHTKLHINYPSIGKGGIHTFLRQVNTTFDIPPTKLNKRLAPWLKYKQSKTDHGSTLNAAANDT